MRILCEWCNFSFDTNYEWIKFLVKTDSEGKYCYCPICGSKHRFNDE